MDPFLTGVAGNMLRQQGQSYLQRGQAFVQTRLGFLSGGSLHYHFSITPEYGAWLLVARGVGMGWGLAVKLQAEAWMAVLRSVTLPHHHLTAQNRPNNHATQCAPSC